MESKFNFENNLDFLINKNVDLSNVLLQKNILNSDNYNKTFKCIEDSLNLLYEKTRVMQDVIEYSNSFIRTEIDNTVTECKSLLDNIETNRDLLKDSAYINYNVKLQSIFDTYSDRNNTPIKGVVLHNGSITLNNNTVETIDLTSLIVESKNSNNNILNTKDEISSNNNYRTFYMFDRTQKDAVKEKLTINLPSPKTINKVNLIPSNCKITSIEFIDENGLSEVIENYDINLFKNRTVKTINIEIECNNYIMSQIDYNEVTNKDFWDIINDIQKDENLIVGKKKYYYYLFGLDKISIEYVDIAETSCFVSKEIKIDELEPDEYIVLDAQYSCEEGNIEFYIIDGTNEIPILPENQKTVLYEKLFYKIPTMFTIDDLNSIKIYDNKIPSKVNINTAMNSVDERYTVSYKPKNATMIDSLMNKSIKVKAVIRTYNKDHIPFIKSMQVKKYGRSSLWIDNNQI